MQKMFSFMSGALCGVVVGAVAALLLTPASGETLQVEARTRLNEALAAARRAEAETRLRLEREYNQMTH